MHTGGQPSQFDSANHFAGGIADGRRHRIGGAFQLYAKRRGADLASIITHQDLLARYHHAVANQRTGLD
ncbi:hypothetical protein D3C76_1579230 [compost metagenome]